ncbi:hypothetical protein llap_13321 [Limosa lapponica baueri]|uniref:Uncharacterized protein n=1 Tax=Limosa lapponica baueri TaxID=1758121 RepID=A0A2I0TRF4_LIMLA|nr:hypothetical protein llap_13321 [Limosa lapponica baueri]
MPMGLLCKLQHEGLLPCPDHEEVQTCFQGNLNVVGKIILHIKQMDQKVDKDFYTSERSKEILPEALANK